MGERVYIIEEIIQRNNYFTGKLKTLKSIMGVCTSEEKSIEMVKDYLRTHHNIGDEIVHPVPWNEDIYFDYYFNRSTLYRYVIRPFELNKPLE